MDPSSSSSSSSSPPVLPKTRELSPSQLMFLEDHFSSHQDLSKAPLLLTELNARSVHLDTILAALRRNLTTHVVSWISLSFGAKTALHNLNIKIQNLSLYTSQHGIGSVKSGRIFGEELSQLAMEVRRIENIRKYAETALQLEALVGDLEDAVLSCVVNQRLGNMFSAKFSDSTASTEFESKQEKFLRAIKAMNNVEEVLVDVVTFQPHWHHLIKSVDTRVDKTLAVLRPHVLADHRSLLASLGWPPKLLTSKIESGQISGIPNPLVLMERDKRKSYSHSFLTLCALQHAQTKREERQHKLLRENKFVVLWAIEELVSPIASRMEYHFSKWVDQPEFVFALVQKFTRDFIVGVDDVLQPLIDKARLVSYSAKEAWVSAMVQMLSGFLSKRIFPALAQRYGDKDERLEVISSWLHLIDLLIAFDKQMQSLINSETYLFLGDTERFQGISSGISVLKIFCDRPDWLKIWSKIELKDACKKLKAELKDDRAWKVDNKGKAGYNETESKQYLLSTREDHKAPPIADFALKIAWGMIERSQYFPAMMPRIQFVRSTAGRFFWFFFNVLLLRCKRTELLHENIDDDALMRVCGSVNAARFVESKLREWSDDMNFVEMKLAENDSDISLNSDNNCTVENSCFFGEEIKSLVELETNWLMELIVVVLHEFETLSWEYVQNKEHFLHEDAADVSSNRVSANTELAVSIDFVQALDTLRNQLSFLKINLNPKDFVDLWRSVAEGLDHFISHSILMSDIQISEEGVNQFEADIQALLHVFQPFCARPDAFFPCIRDSLMLLKLNEEEVKYLLVVLSDEETGVEHLRFRGISHISRDQADKVLSNRKFRT